MPDDLATLSAALRLTDDPASLPTRTICEVLREIGRIAHVRGDIDTLQKVLEATLMAKRMQRKLEDAKNNHPR